MPYIPQFQMTGTSLFSAYASLIGMLILVRTMLNFVIPDELRAYLIKAFHSIFKKSGPDQLTLTVDQHFGHNRNHVYEAAEAYLRTIINSAVDRLKVGKTQPQKKFTISIEKGQEIVDTYMGMQIIWKYVLKESQKESGGRQISPYQFGSDPYHFEIVFEKKLKDMVLGAYLPYVMDRFEQIKNEEKVVRMFTREGAGGGRFHHHDENPPWSAVSLKHPVTFDKLAMEPDLKKMIIDDLDQFVSRKEFYQKVGKAWKRGYLLYGLPGTGKSSLIAAMANYLKFDIYDLQLSRIHSDSQLRNILMSIPNRSILIMEDIDCSVELHGRNVTLSGFLNFIDGLWSSCGDELIIVFTTNHKEKLDPALLRPGRMDVQIHMSYCTPAGFKILASNYLDIEDTHHPLFQEIEGLIIPAKVTPAEIAEELTRSEDPDTVLNSVLSLLKQKINGQSRVSVSQNQSISYCTPAGFKNLASDHLDDIEDSDAHSLFEEMESLIIPAKVTPAEVVDELTRSEDPETALDGGLSLLKRKLTEQQALIQKLARNTA